MPSLLTIGLVIPQGMTQVEESLHQVLAFYQCTSAQLLIVNQHEDQLVQTIVEKEILQNARVTAIQVAEMNEQQAMMEALNYIKTPYAAFLTVGRDECIRYPEKLEDKVNVLSSDGEMAGFNQLVMTVAHWQQDLTTYDTLMEVLFAELSATPTVINIPVKGQQTAFVTTTHLADLYTYQQLVGKYRLSERRVSADLVFFVENTQPSTVLELNEMQQVIKKLLPENQPAEIQQFLAQKTVEVVPKEKVKQSSMDWFRLVASLHKKHKKRFYFCSQRSDGGQPYRLFLWLQKNDPDGDYIWEGREHQFVSAINVPQHSREALIALSTAEYIITDTWLDDRYMKRKGQTIVKILPFYPLYKEGFASPLYQTALKTEQTREKEQMAWWDVLLVPSAWYKQHYQVEFTTNAKIIATDFLTAPTQDIHQIKTRALLPQDKRIILFYPQEGTQTLPFNLCHELLMDDCIWVAPYQIAPQQGLFNLHEDMTTEEMLTIADVIVTDGNPDVMLPQSRYKTIIWWMSAAQEKLIKRWMNVDKTFPFMTVSSVKELQMAFKFDDDPVDVSTYVNYPALDMESLWTEIFSTSGKVGQTPAAVRILAKTLPLRHVYQQLFDLLAHRQKKNIITFESFYGRQYSDNPKALYQYMKKNYPQFQCYWLVDKKEENLFVENQLPHIVHNSWKELWIQTKAKYWVVNMRLPQWKYPGKGTTLIQTWHGTPLKTLGLDIKQVTMPGVTTAEYQQQFLTDVSKWDYLLAPNEYSSQIFQKAFRLPQQKIINSGYPRNDRLFTASDEEIAAIKKELHIKPDQKVVLYAPTWRDTNNKGQGSYYFGLQLDLQAMEKAFGDEVVFLIRAHYLISEQLDVSAYPQVRDVSHYPDISDLYLASDVLVTDYSSVFFDYANLHRPMIFYAYDEQEYAGDMRGFYFDYQTVPGPIVHTTEEVVAEIQKALAQPQLQAKYAPFIQQYCQWEDGHAAQRVCDFILEGKNYDYQTVACSQTAVLTGSGALYEVAFPTEAAQLLLPLAAYKQQSVEVLQKTIAIDPLHQTETGYTYYEIKIQLLSGQCLTGWVLTESLQFDVSS